FFQAEDGIRDFHVTGVQTCALPSFRGVQAYFKRHAYGNTRLSDLLGALEETYGRDVKTWSRKWLETAGINILRPRIETDADGIITSFAVQQEAPALPAGAKGEPTLR